MTCKEVAEFLMEYLEGSLPTGAHEVFEQHVRICVDCRRYIDSYKRTIAMGRAAHQETELSDPPEELVQSILRARARADAGAES